MPIILRAADRNYTVPEEHRGRYIIQDTVVEGNLRVIRTYYFHIDGDGVLHPTVRIEVKKQRMTGLDPIGDPQVTDTVVRPVTEYIYAADPEHLPPEKHPSHKEKFRKIRPFPGPISKPMIKRKSKSNESYKFHTGMRVFLSGCNLNDRSQYRTGTVVKTMEGMGRIPRVIVCMDQSAPAYAAKSVSCPPYHELTVRADGLIPLELYIPSDELYRDLPAEVGVVVGASFSHDRVTFRSGDVGRPVAIAPHGVDRSLGPLMSVNWLNKRSSEFWEIAGYINCYKVPASKLRWCTLKRNGGKLRADAVWPKASYNSTNKEGCSFKKGDLLVYRGSKPLITNASMDNKNVRGIVGGTILRNTGRSEDLPASFLVVTVAGGVAPDLLGRTIQIEKRYVELFEGVYIAKGTRVSITGTVLFKKKSLQDKMGTVVLPTDEDGDVGIEFDENINAGSLDGAGKEGKCLYIPATAVKCISE